MKRLGARLTERYGRGYSWQNIFRMMRAAELYPDVEIFSPVATIVTSKSLCELSTISEQGKRDCYLAFCAHERWSKRTLRAKIAGKLHERTIAARGSADGLEADHEGAILDEMQRFLLKLGVGFTFTERQKRMTDALQSAYSGLCDHTRLGILLV